MKMVLAAIIALPCSSPLQINDALNTLTAYSCPATVSYYWVEHPETPMDVARVKHHWSLPRDDKAPLVVAQAAPVVQEAPVVRKASKPSKKAKRKKKKRRR